MSTDTVFTLAPLVLPFGSPRKEFRGIEFDAPTDNIFKPRNPVLETLPTQQIDYGRLFTYCFRRFGFPNTGSDHYKDIAQWMLTTPHQDLVFIVRPSVLPEPHFSLHFAVPKELWSVCKHWERADVDAWFQRKLDWAEAQGLPEWMPDLVKSYRGQVYPQATWRDVYLSYIIFYEPRDGFGPTIGQESDEEKRDRAMLSGFAAKVAVYIEIEPMPEFRKRPAKLEDWAADDPMKPLAEAAIVALKDLSTPVLVRDSAIDAFGVVENDENTVREGKSAGYGFGRMLNEAPQQCAQIYALALDLGNGDFGAGLLKILKRSKK